VLRTISPPRESKKKYFKIFISVKGAACWNLRRNYCVAAALKINSEMDERVRAPLLPLLLVAAVAPQLYYYHHRRDRSSVTRP
jgi:hypothetical protein